MVSRLEVIRKAGPVKLAGVGRDRLPGGAGPRLAGSTAAGAVAIWEEVGGAW